MSHSSGETQPRKRRRVSCDLDSVSHCQNETQNHPVSRGLNAGDTKGRTNSTLNPRWPENAHTNRGLLAGAANKSPPKKRGGAPSSSRVRGPHGHTKQRGPRLLSSLDLVDLASGSPPMTRGGLSKIRWVDLKMSKKSDPRLELWSYRVATDHQREVANELGT